MSLNKGIAIFQGKINGSVRFSEMPDKKHIAIDVEVKGLNKNALHGFHVHEYGDLSDGCNSMCAHLNPYNETHGGPETIHRHVGDLGNLKSDGHGCANFRFYDNMIKLRGTKSNIIGRGLIIHEDEDDCGLGKNKESKITGNAGKRIACAVIGFASNS
jgi:superoxide dismutase, Cu-Zn family